MDSRDRALYDGMRGNHAFDFAQFDPDAAYLDLVVASAKEFNASVVAVTAHIAGKINNVIWIIRPGIRGEAANVLCLSVDIAARSIRRSHNHLAEFPDSARR